MRICEQGQSRKTHETEFSDNFVEFREKIVEFLGKNVEFLKKILEFCVTSSSFIDLTVQFIAVDISATLRVFFETNFLNIIGVRI